MTKPNTPYQLTPGAISPVRENIPLFPSTTSWHHWLLQGFLPKWGSLKNGFAFLQKYSTECIVHLQWNSVGSTDYLYCLNSSVSATFSPSKKVRKWNLHSSQQYREIKGMCSKVLPVLNQWLSIHVVHSYSSVSIEGNTTQSVCHTAPTSDNQQIHKNKPEGFSEAPLYSLSSLALQDIFTYKLSFQEHIWKASR